MDNKNDLHDSKLALLELGYHLYAQEIGFGADAKDDDSLIENAIKMLQKRICPKKLEILKQLNSPITSASSIIFDAIISMATNLPLAIATLAKEILRVGIDEFCKNPMLLVKND